MSEFLGKYAVYIFVGLFVGWFVWMRWLAPAMAGVASISAAEYIQSHRNSKHTLLDVRSHGEFARQHAPKAQLIPLSELSARLGEIDRDKPVIVICASGNRSLMAATALAKSGFTEVYNFSGGMAAWGTAGLPVRSGS